MQLTKLQNHPWIKQLGSVARGIALRDSDYPPLTTNYDYVVSIYSLVENVTSCLDQLYYSIDMLSGYRSSGSMKRLSRVEYIRFGIENYYLRYTSVFDRCLLVTNGVFQLGLSPQACNVKTVVKNHHVQVTEVAQALKKLDRLTEKVRVYRNEIAHRQSYSDSSLKNIEFLSSLQVRDDIIHPKFTEEFDYCLRPKYLQILNKFSMDRFVQDKKQEFTNEIEDLEGCIEEFMNSVEKVFYTKVSL